MSRSISEMAAMIRFPAQAHPAVHAAEIQSPAHPRKKKNRMALGQTILMVSEAAPGLLQSCDTSSTGANAEWSSRGRGGGNVYKWVSICGWHAKILSAIQVYRFWEMCQRIMNNPVVAPMFHTYFSPEGRKMDQLEVVLSSGGATFHCKQRSGGATFHCKQRSGGATFHYKQRSVWTNRYTRENTFPSIIGISRFLLKQLRNR